MSQESSATPFEASPNPHAAPSRQPRGRLGVDLGAMALYGTIVHSWSLWITPLGPDAARLGGAAGLSGPSQWSLAAAMSLFGGSAAPYHLVNAVLIYACMVCIYLMVTGLTRGPSWLGVFAANLWMASPGHREATVALTGMVDLLPCLAALLAVLTFLFHQARPTPSRLVVLASMLFVATVAFPVNQWLGVVLLIAGWLVWADRPGHAIRTALCVVATLAGLCAHAWPSLETASLFDRYGALYFCFYGIGFLPESAVRFVAMPWLAWLSAGTVVALLAVIHWKAARPAFLAVLLGMLVYRSSAAVVPVDPVHLIGGGSLVFPTALFMMGVAVVYYRAMEHQRWLPVLGLTSITASAIFFLMMINAIAGWREASRMVSVYHAAAAAAHERTGEPVLVIPDFQAMHGAPVQLSRVLSHDTPFMRAVPHEAAVRLDYQGTPEVHYSLTQQPPQPVDQLIVGGPEAAAVLRNWADGPCCVTQVGTGYRIHLGLDMSNQRRRWVPFGEVLWAVFESGSQVSGIAHE